MTKLTVERAESARKSLILLYFVQGFASMVFVPLVPQLINQIGVNFVQWGSILGFTGLAGLIPLTFTHRLVARFGTRRVIRIASSAAVIVMMIFPFTHNWYQFFIAQALLNMSNSAFTLSLNSTSVMLQKKMKRTIVGAMHATWSFGAASSAAISGVMMAFLDMPIHVAIVSVLCAIAIQFATSNLLDKTTDGSKSEQSRVKKVSWLKTPPFVWLLTVGLFAGVFPEASMIDWSSVFAKRELATIAGASAIPYTVFTGAMIIGRLSIGPITKRIHLSEMAKWGGLIGSGLLLIGDLAGPALGQQNPALGLTVTCLFFGLAGLGVGPMVPSFFTAAGNVVGLTTTQALSRMSMMNTFLIMFAKTLMGALAQQSMQLAFLLPVATLFAAGVFSAFVVTKAKRNEDEMLTAFPMTGPVDITEIE